MDIVSEILDILSEGKPMSSKEITSELKYRGINLEDRTVRYHLKKMEIRGFLIKTSNGKRIITNKGLEELKQASVSERLGEFSERIEYNAYFCNFDLYSLKGLVPTNLAIINKDKFDAVIDVLVQMGKFPFLISDLVAVSDEGETLGNLKIAEGKFGIATVSNTIYDVILRFAGVSVTPEFAGLLNCRRYEPQGFTELISYRGTTLSPGWLFLKSGLTSVLKCLKTGYGKIITVVRSFSKYALDTVRSEIKIAKLKGFGGIVGILHPSSRQFSLPLRNRARLIVSAGLNHIAPLQELGFNPEIRVNEVFVEFSELKKVDKVY
ncbi:hypothetical protein B6U96_11990 [Archaeoglobales archaeon ex4484_92]|nr:MAG: hypothetical protein B6U96_11990 [Archaeoglobales archaeon ex4484_92]